MFFHRQVLIPKAFRYPIYSFFLPVYAFWRMDDFSWGNTRLVVGEGANKKVLLDEEDKFDESMIPLKKFSGKSGAKNIHTVSMLIHHVQSTKQTHGKQQRDTLGKRSTIIVPRHQRELAINSCRQDQERARLFRTTQRRSQATFTGIRTP